MSWQRKLIETDSKLFPIVQKAIRIVEYPKIKHVIKLKNNNILTKIMFIFNWTNKDTCSFEMFEEVTV